MRKLIKGILYFSLLAGSNSLTAQSAIDQVVNKLESYKNYSYSSVEREMELFKTDTITINKEVLFIKTPQDTSFGYLFSVKNKTSLFDSNVTEIWDGQDIVHLVQNDSTYDLLKKNRFDIQGTLNGRLKWLQGRVDKKMAAIKKLNDTTLNGIGAVHLFVVVADTIINKERNYTFVDLYINKLSGIPDCIICKARYSTFGPGVTNWYSETHFSNYQFNRDDIDRTALAIPAGYHPPVPREKIDLLASGSTAPDWTLQDADGKKMSLRQLKGKVVLLDFFFIGCGGCMEALQPLNRLHEKYKDKNIRIVSMSFRDNAKAVKTFQADYNIKYPIFIEAGEVVKSYHVPAFPTFYYIDKKGKIAAAFTGYLDDFEARATTLIDNLLKD